LNAARQDARNAALSRYIESAFPQRQRRPETLRTDYGEPNALDIGAFLVDEPKARIEVDGSTVFVMRKLGFQSNIRRIYEAVRYLVLHKEVHADRRQNRQQHKQPISFTHPLPHPNAPS